VTMGTGRGTAGSPRRRSRRPPSAPTGGGRSPEPPSDGTGWTEDWFTLDGERIFYRRGPVTGGVPTVHIHGFGISGTYMMPTARLLAGRGSTVVPDLPGYGRSTRSGRPLAIPALAGSVEGILDGLGFDKAVLIGNSMGCAVALQVAHDAPDRVHRLVLVSPAGGRQNQPLGRAVGQLVVDAARESPRMARVAIPDYVGFGPVNAFNLFAQLTRFPALERLLNTPVPTLAVLGDRDPLMPPPQRVREVQRMSRVHIAVALIQGAAHAINFSHPGELANVVSTWLDGRDIVDDPLQPGHARELVFDEDVVREAEPEA
jgi:pimeloyl-ACP methyl ester carboxylesterase